MGCYLNRLTASFLLSFSARCLERSFIYFTQRAVFWSTEGCSNNCSKFSEGTNYRSKNCSNKGEKIITQKFMTSYHSLQIIVWKFTSIKTIGTTKIQWHFIKISFQAYHQHHWAHAGMENPLLGVITRKHEGSPATQSISHHWKSSVKFCRITKATWKTVTDTWDGYHSVPLRHHAICLLKRRPSTSRLLVIGGKTQSTLWCCLSWLKLSKLSLNAGNSVSTIVCLIWHGWY